MAQEARKLVGIWEIQHWLKFESSETFIQVTEDKSMENEREANNYEPTYLDRKNQPVFNMGNKESISFEIDALAPGGIQQELAKYEDTANVSVTYVRTIGYDLVQGKPAPANALVAKQAAGILNMNPFKGEGGEPITISGTIAISSEYEKGTFDPTQKKFTPAKA